MANLQKVVKLTQAQYDTLASGGTVGDYTGLDENYIYLVENNDEYPTITQLDHDYDSLTASEMQLIANSKAGDMFYSVSWGTLGTIAEDWSTGKNLIVVSGQTIMSFRYIDEDGEGNWICDDVNTWTIPEIDLTTTAGSEAISVSNQGGLNLVTRDTTQNITGKKTFRLQKNGASGYADGLYIDLAGAAAGNYGYKVKLNLENTNVSSKSGQTYTQEFQSKAGTIALTSDIPESQMISTTGTEINSNFSDFLDKLNSGKPVRLSSSWNYERPPAAGVTFYAGSIFYTPYTTYVPGEGNKTMGIFKSEGLNRYKYTISNNVLMLEDYDLPKVKRYI